MTRMGRTAIAVVGAAAVLGAAGPAARAINQEALDSGPWVMQTRQYAAGDDNTWDAYVLNTRTGELWFVNQNVKTQVQDGKPRGAGK